MEENYDHAQCGWDHQCSSQRTEDEQNNFSLLEASSEVSQSNDHGTRHKCGFRTVDIRCPTARHGTISTVKALAGGKVYVPQARRKQKSTDKRQLSIPTLKARMVASQRCRGDCRK